MCWTLRCQPLANLDRAIFALRILAEIERRPVRNTIIPAKVNQRPSSAGGPANCERGAESGAVRRRKRP
jgi:hypothetical protein